MLDKLSIIGVVVAVVLMIPTAVSAQMGGAINPGVHVGGAVNPGASVRGAVERGIPSVTTTSESEFSLHTTVDDAALVRGDPASDRGVVGAAASSLPADMIFGNDRLAVPFSHREC